MTKKDRITRKTSVLTADLGSLLLIFMVSANTIWSSRQTNVATDEAVSEVSSFYLEAMADRRAKTITNLTLVLVLLFSAVLLVELMIMSRKNLEA